MNDTRNRNPSQRNQNHASKKKRFFDKKNHAPNQSQNNSSSPVSNDSRNQPNMRQQSSSPNTSQPNPPSSNSNPHSPNRYNSNRNHHSNHRRNFGNSNQNQNQNQNHKQNTSRNHSPNDSQFRKNPNLEYGSINTKMALPPEPSFVPTPLKKYGILRFETFAQAKAKMEEIVEAAKNCDQLNIIIKAEGDMDDPDLKTYGKVFAGDAWYLIHERRLEEKWYEIPH